MNNPAKNCSTCKVSKSVYDYYKDASTKDGLKYICKVCSIRSASKWSRDNRKKRNARIRLHYKSNKLKFRNIALRTNYGITLDTYNSMFNEQGGKCGICKRHQSEFKLKLSVDHSHDSGTIRKLLCGSCNTALGLFKDNPDNLRSAIKYLESYAKNR